MPIVNSSVEIMLPGFGISRHYIISFLHLIDHNKADLSIHYNMVRVVSRGAPIGEIIAEAFEKVALSLEHYNQQRQRWGERADTQDSSQEDTEEEEMDGGGAKKRTSKKTKDKIIEIPATGNERKSFITIKEGVGLTEDSSFVDVFRNYAERIRREPSALSDFESGSGSISDVSLFRPELYQNTRGPFFDGRLSSDKVRYELRKHTIGTFLIRLGGYVVSRVGRVKVSGPGGRPKYLTALVLPTDPTRVGDFEFESRIRQLREERLPGLRPEEGVIMWLAAVLGDVSSDMLVVGMSDPRSQRGGQNPATIDIRFAVPLRSYRKRAAEFFRAIESARSIGTTTKIELFKWRVGRLIRDYPSSKSVRLLKLLFRASQYEQRSVDEFLFTVSKMALEEVNEPLKRQLASNLLFTVSDAFRS